MGNVNSLQFLLQWVITVPIIKYAHGLLSFVFLWIYQQLLPDVSSKYDALFGLSAVFLIYVCRWTIIFWS